MRPTIIELSDTAFNAIVDELAKAGCLDAIIFERDRSVTLDMHGICLLRKAENVIDFPERID